jgi:glycosyltransferase involved in cell wall biosynthesis
MKITPKVSIVIPVYNGSKYLRQTVNSVLAQDLAEFEVLIIDDGSTDDTAGIAIELKENDNRIELFWKKNSGVSAARNFGLERARGEFVVFLDADDLLGADFLRSRVEALRVDSSAGACGSLIGFIDENGERIDQSVTLRAPADKMLEEILFYKNGVATIPSNLVFRKQVLAANNILFDMRLHSSADRLLLCRVALVSKCISLPCQNIFYRVHGGSMYHGAGNVNKIFKDNELFITILISEHIVPEKLMGEFLKRNYYMLSGAAMKAGDYAASIRYAFKYGSATIKYLTK